MNKGLSVYLSIYSFTFGGNGRGVGSKGREGRGEGRKGKGEHVY